MAHQLSENLNQILKDTSRAFYLSLAILPPKARRPLSLAYLLARAADTVADSEADDETDRAATLRALQDSVSEQDPAVSAMLHQFKPEHPGERKLLEHWPDLLQELSRSDPGESEDICRVVHTLIEGMLWDQELFCDSSTSGLTLSQLERYTYLVAGCVGPFWSTICASGDFKLQTLLTDEHRDLAVEFGKALQWVNILRDIPKDQEQGRFYLPPLESTRFGPHFLTASRRTLEAFQRATAYPVLYPSTYLRNRLAVILPLILGLRTLEKLFEAGPRQGVRIKVTRKEVFFWLGFGVLLAPLSPLLKETLHYLHARAQTALNKLEHRNE